jgi:hypothetical protein
VVASKVVLVPSLSLVPFSLPLLDPVDTDEFSWTETDDGLIQVNLFAQKFFVKSRNVLIENMMSNVHTSRVTGAVRRTFGAAADTAPSPRPRPNANLNATMKQDFDTKRL